MLMPTFCRATSNVLLIMHSALKYSLVNIGWSLRLFSVDKWNLGGTEAIVIWLIQFGWNNLRRNYVTRFVHHDIVHAAQLGIVRFERLGRCQRGAQRQDELMLVETDGQLEARNLSRTLKTESNGTVLNDI